MMKTTCVVKRDDSPNSVVYTFDSNFSVFSSASGSIDRCSIASDSPSLASSDFSLAPGRLVGGGDIVFVGEPMQLHRSSDLVAGSLHNVNHARLDLSVDTINSSVADDDKERGIVSPSTKLTPRTTVSYSTSGSSPMNDDDYFHHLMMEKGEARRPLSLDLRNQSSGVPDCSASSRSGENFPSPGTSSYLHQGSVLNKVWSSERASLPSAPAGNNHKLHHTRGSLQFSPNCGNITGKTLPSKWEDAERWIFSPGSHPKAPPLQQGTRKPKAKSGPLAQHFPQSPADPNPVNHDKARSGQVGCSSSIHYEPFMTRSVSIHGCPEGMARHSIHTLRDAKMNDFTGISRSGSRRDIATQMSPNGSFHSSPAGRFSFSRIIPTVQPDIDLQWHSFTTTKLNLRDVQVDEKLSATKWSKGSLSRKNSTNFNKLNNNPNHTFSSFNSMRESDEAKINAWESLQKAKAEKAIRKLEMKLEKRRSSSMEKIMSKLRSAQNRAEKMRCTVLSHEKKNKPRPSKIIYLTACFACHAF